MAFRLEQDMLPAVQNWLATRVAEHKLEFSVPWGYCDLVGCTLSPKRALRRIRMGQKQAIGPLERVSLLWEIPEVDDAGPVTLDDLVSRLSNLSSKRVLRELAILEERGFVLRSADGAYWRHNGWFPLQQLLIAVELKLDRVDEVIEQATRHLGFADESYIALPIEKARELMRSSVLMRIRESGLGMVGVSPDSARTLVRARKSSKADPVVQAHCVERFWQTSAIGS